MELISTQEFLTQIAKDWVAHPMERPQIIAGWAKHMDARERLIRLDERSKASIEIKRQRAHYEADHLFGAEYCDGMGDAATIVFDADKQGEELQYKEAIVS